MIRIGVLCLLCLLSLPAFGDGERPRVQVEAGPLAGERREGVDRFLGIPYAAAPTGERRWRPPAPATGWDGLRDVTVAGAACPQASQQAIGVAPARQDEDCLFLNVWAPADAERLPVMVWIHGGAHRFGAGSLPYYEGASLAGRGVVVVTLNYRLGYLGYFSHPALDGEDAGGNFGFMDQLAALHWVQRNIAAFGGDPARVTVFGESAGGVAVLMLMASPEAEGLFAGAIVQSGGGWAMLPDAVAMRRRVQAGLDRIDMPADADASVLRAVPAERLVDAIAADRSLGFGPFVDGVSVVRQPVDVFRNGRQASVPLLIGSNTWEGSLMQALDPGEQGRRLADSKAVRELYRNETQDDAVRQQLLFGDLVFGAPARWIAAMQARKSSAWLYRFGYVRSGRRGQVPGVGHGSEIPYVFDVLGRSGGGASMSEMSEADLRMSRDVADCWVAFATHGRPDCVFAPWDAYSRRRDNTMDIADDEARQVQRLRAPILDAIDRFFSPDARR
ncbi:carboxylesterase/lipase family protein [Luteimonas aestuarii]|nr:carboxylesterase family protein [Luteimonas aestuarii]